MQIHTVFMDRETILLRLQYLMQSLSKSYLAFFCISWQADPKISMEIQDVQNSQKQSLRIIKLEDFHFLISELTVKL